MHLKLHLDVAIMASVWLLHQQNDEFLLGYHNEHWKIQFFLIEGDKREKRCLYPILK